MFLLLLAMERPSNLAEEVKDGIGQLCFGLCEERRQGKKKAARHRCCQIHREAGAVKEVDMGVFVGRQGRGRQGHVGLVVAV